MAGEVQFSFKNGATAYFLTRNSVGQLWNVSGAGAFENFVSGNYASYAISCNEQGSTGYYTGNFPGAIIPGTYAITAKQQLTGGAIASDPTVAVGNLEWNGSTVLPLSNLTTSGQLASLTLQELYKGQMVQNFPIYLKSATDHVTPLTSGVVSGQISKDGGPFGPLQSGAFTETGLGYYNLQALTSGDLNCGTASVLFTANQISGGPSDPLPMSFILKRTP